MNAMRLVPGYMFFELKASLVGIEADPQHKGQDEGDQTGAKSKPAKKFGLAAWQEEDDQRRKCRDEQDQAKKMSIEEIHHVLLCQQEKVD